MKTFSRENANVAVITVNYFGADDTRRCIGSLQESSVDIHIVVVDNSPKDPSLQKIKSNFCSEVTFIDPTHNLGFGEGNNFGVSWVLENTKCEYVLILNNDARVEPESISKLVQCLEKNPELGAVSGLIFVEGSDKIWFGGGSVDFARGGGRTVKLASDCDHEEYLESDFLSGAVMMVRREVIKTVGLFDPAFFMYEEDIDLSLRICKAGWSLGLCRDAVFHHRVQGSQRSDSSVESKPRWAHDNPNFNFLVYYNVRNNIINIRKHAHKREFIRIVAVYPCWLSFKTLAAARGRGLSAFLPVWKGIKDGLSANISKGSQLEKLILCYELNSD